MAHGKVFVVDDDPEVCRSVQLLLEAEGLDVEAYTSGSDFLMHADLNQSGCVLLDIRMPGMDGLDVQQSLVNRGCPLPIVFVTGHGDVQRCTQAMKRGAMDFIEKPVRRGELVEVVERALERGEQRDRWAQARSKLMERLELLTDREREVLKLLYDAMSIKGIARQLGIGFQTAAKHRARVLKKLDVQSEPELVRLLHEYDLEPK